MNKLEDSKSGIPACSDPESLWAFGPPDQEIRVGNADLLLAHLSIFLSGWPCRRLDAPDGFEMDIGVVERADGKFDIHPVASGEPRTVFDNAFEAADGLARRLVDTFVARHADAVSLCASGIQLDSSLIVLLGAARAGTSSVAIHLAAAGYRLFSENRMALRMGNSGSPTGLCLGLTPRVRLPLASDCGQRFTEYVESFTEIRDGSTAYLRLWEGEAAVFLEQAPIRAFVILDHVETGQGEIAPATPSQIGRALMAQCSSPPSDSGPLEVAMMDLAAGAPGHKLTFSRSAAAATLLSKTFRGGLT